MKEIGEALIEFVTLSAMQMAEQSPSSVHYDPTSATETGYHGMLVCGKITM
jgi:hypothetical protein